MYVYLCVIYVNIGCGIIASEANVKIVSFTRIIVIYDTKTKIQFF